MKINSNILKTVSIILLLVVIALVSVVKIAPLSTDVEKHEEVITQIDSEIDTVLKLTAGAAGASAVISLLPDDQCTPIANELAELAKYFLVVLSALYLEKYLVTMLGYVSFSFLIPIACLCWGVGYFVKRGSLRTLSYKFALLAFALYLMIPISVRASTFVYENFDTSIAETIAESDRISITEASEDASLVEKFTTWISNAAVTVTEYVTNLLSDFVDALAIMIVTSCLIPILVVVFFVYLMKILFGIKVPSFGHFKGEE